MSSIHVTVRLSRDSWTRYSAEARARGSALGTHLRHRLEEQDRLIAELALWAATEQAAATAEEAKDAPSTTDSGTIVEMLLILRSLAGPRTSAIAQAEVERRGMDAWK